MDTARQARAGLMAAWEQQRRFVEVDGFGVSIAAIPGGGIEVEVYKPVEVEGELAQALLDTIPTMVREFCEVAWDLGIDAEQLDEFHARVTAEALANRETAM